MKLEKKGWISVCGDLEGAYYNTKGSGFLRLPSDWPSGTGNFMPNEVVQLHCAIPGDGLSSSLFLNQVDKLLSDYPATVGTVRYSENHSLLINFSDDFAGVFSSVSSKSDIEAALSKQYPIEFTVGWPERWVGFDVLNDQNGILLSNKSASNRYQIENAKLPLLNIMQSISVSEKSNDDKLISAARSSVGKLAHLSQLNLFLAYPAAYMASALHYDPENVIRVCESLIYASQVRPSSIPFTRDEKNVIAIYSDSSHDIATCKAVSGVVIQLQSSDEPQALANVISYSSCRLASLYNSSYAAETKGVSNAIEHYLSVKSAILSLNSSCNFRVILFCDNKGLVDTLSSHSSGSNPFSTSIIDFCKQWLSAESIVIKWVPTSINHADSLTKFKK